jgi:glycerol uptake facilitator protein
LEDHSLSQRLAAEFIGTALLVFVGAGSVPAMVVLASEASPFSGAEVGMVALAFGLIVTAMVYTIGKVSGCHINPAVTFALAATRRFPWRELPHYWTAQVAGAIGGALAIWASFGGRAFDFGAGFGVVDFNGAVTSWGSAMFVEALGTGILMFTILGIVDTRSPEGWAGLVIGLVVVAIIITVGPERLDQPRTRARAAPGLPCERLVPQLDGAAARLHPGEPHRRDGGRARLRLDGHPAAHRPPDQGGRLRARPRRRSARGRGQLSGSERSHL